MTGSFNFVGGFGSVEAEITAELTSKLRPLSLYALSKNNAIKISESLKPDISISPRALFLLFFFSVEDHFLA